MRIHYLALEAIGPFAARYEIDFDELSAGGLFLLEGPTGAGKSTIIDAIVFALYGRVASDTASEQRLHSTHADPTVTPQVELVFTTGSGTYRVHRAPKHERPKRRGQGTTTQHAQARLWRLPHWDGPPVGDTGSAAGNGSADEAAFGRPVAATTQEVGTELRGILTLDVKQFTQTVVLPQGQFATFLQAAPEERRAVLQEVFGTRVYEDVQDRLTEDARRTRREVEAAQAGVAEAVRAFVRAAELGDDDDVEALTEAAAHSQAEVLTERTGPVLDRLTAARTSADSARQAAEDADERARTELATAEDLERRLARRRELLNRQATLDARAEHIAAESLRLQIAERAATLTAPMDLAAGARHDADAADARLAHVRGRAHELPGAAGSTPPTWLTDSPGAAVLRSTAHKYQRLLGGLQQLLDVEAGLPARRDDIAEQAAGLCRRRESLTTTRTALDQRPVERSALTQRHDAAKHGAARLPAAQAAAAHARTVLAAAEEVSGLAPQIDEARQAATRLGDEARTAADEAHRLRQRWVTGMAGVLASGLEATQPCPVCGASEHPAPARPAADHVTTEAVEAAEQRQRQLSTELQAAANHRDVLGERLAGLEKQTGGLSREQASDRLRDAQGELTTAEQASGEVTGLAAELTTFDATTTELSTQASRGETEIAAEQHRLTVARDRLAEDEARIAAQLAGSPSIAARATELTEHARLADELAAAEEAVTQRRHARDEAADHLARAVATAGFTSVADAEQALLDADGLTELRRELEEHRSTVHQVREGLAEEALATLTGEEEPGVAVRQAACRTARETMLTASAAASSATGLEQRAHAALESLHAALAAYEKRFAASRAVLRMAALASGGDGNQHSTTLATFVLLRRFEDVVAAANQRLDVMSDGRYRLSRIDEREGGQRSRRAGLGLEVHDNLTDSARDPHTLSGGETFYVSLCLALGLADVVASEAGGVSLETLFIDEGFGALDPETLDGVLTELTRLQAGGRAVGIVSHVTELKSRIAERIEVRRTPGGASCLVVRA